MEIDLHCHIDLFDNPFILVNECEKRKIFTLAVSNTPQMFDETRQHIQDYKYTIAALGIHPTIKGSLKRHIKEFRELVHDTQFIGEIGLDGTASKENQLQQQDILELILNECSKINCIISLHSRRKETLLLDMVHNHLKCKVIFHWYSGSKEIADKIVEGGHYFSINLLMLKTESTRKKLLSIPKDRILTESDGPFAKYKGKSLSPLSIHETLTELSALWSTTKSNAEMIVEENFRKLAKSNNVDLHI